MTEAIIALGGNIGDVAARFPLAIETLLARAPARLIARSSDYETPPWGEENQPAFRNAVIIIATALAPRDLLRLLHDIERDHGRDRTREQRWGPRTLDLDLIAYGDHQIDEAGITIPHPRFAERAFVMVPLAEIAPNKVILGRRVADYPAAISQQGIKRLSSP